MKDGLVIIIVVAALVILLSSCAPRAIVYGPLKAPPDPQAEACLLWLLHAEPSGWIEGRPSICEVSDE